MKLLLASLLAGMASAQSSIIETAAATPILSTLVDVLSDPQYSAVFDALSGDGPFTVFAPTNAAFAAAGLDTSMVELVSATLFYHVLSGSVPAADVVANAPFFPATVSADNDYVKLGSGVGQSLKVAVEGGDVVINGMQAVLNVTDVYCTNGIVHIINDVLMLPGDVSVTATSDGLSELVSAVVKAGLVSTIDDTERLTIFAPTNDAMLAAGWDTLSTEQLTDVLTYHVIAVDASSDMFYSTNLPSGVTDVATLNGQSVTLNVDGAGVMVNDANVVIADVLTASGVVHVIDAVLLPATDEPTMMPTTEPTEMESPATTVIPTCTALLAVFSMFLY